MMLIFTLFIIVAAIGTIATLVVGRKKVEQKKHHRELHIVQKVR